MGLLKRRNPLDEFGSLSTSDSEINATSPAKVTFSKWCRTMWLDILCLATVAAYGYIIFKHKKPFSTRLFPVEYNNDIVYPELAYPQRKELLPAFLTTVISFGIPFVVICLMQLFVQSFWDWNNAVLGLFYSLIGASVFQVTIKLLIGGLRPHFLSVCQPNISEAVGQGYRNIMYDRTVCTGDDKEIDDAMTSFPSGHAAGACAGFIYLAFYLCGKVKPFQNRRTQFWKLFIIMLPIEIATLLSASKCVDEWHNWYDVLAGAIIGIMFACLAYRSMYAAIWDQKSNHAPLMGDEDFELGKL